MDISETEMNSLLQMIQGSSTGNSVLDTVLFGEFTLANLIAVIIIAAVVFVLCKIASRAIRHNLSGKIDAKNADGLAKLAVWVIVIIGLLVASPQLHIDFTGLLVAGGAITVALGFASQNTLSNFIAGILLMIEHPISIGDVVIISDTEGYVEKISILSTHIKTYDGLVLRIPNSNVFSAEITNCVSNVARRFSYTVDISYESDAEKAIAIINEAIASHPYALSDPEPMLYVEELGAHGIQIAVRIWAPSQYWWTARTELLWEIFIALKNNDIEIPFNQLVLWYGEENARKLSENIRSGKSATEILQSSNPKKEA